MLGSRGRWKTLYRVLVEGLYDVKGEKEELWTKVSESEQENEYKVHGRTAGQKASKQ